MVVTSIRAKIHKVRFFCMVLSLAASRHCTVSSCLFTPSRAAVVNGVSCQRRRQHHHHWARLAFASNNPSPPRPALLNRNSRTALHYPLYDRLMSPSKSMSSISMSAAASAGETSSTSSSSVKVKDTNADAHKEMIGKKVPSTPQSLKLCGERLRSGDLVSFPTETVYGLGCHALDQIAVQKVFDAKERPLSDPLIVHVTKIEDALELWAASSSMDSTEQTEHTETSMQQQQQQKMMRQIEKQALTALTQSFFPGPLTLVARAHPSIPQILMANTGYVACRAPSHPIARALIDAAEVPIAAPSANKFGHVSPTTAGHVMDDLGGEDVWVVDPTLGSLDENDNDGIGKSPQDDDGAESHVVCQVGVESTVAKIEMNSNNDNSDSEVVGSITVLRHGAVSSQSIREALEKEDLSKHFAVSDSVKFTSEKVHTVAPGQMVKHYSPNVPCFMISSSRQQQQSEDQLDGEERAMLSQSVIIDYGKRLVQYRSQALAYRDLSPEGNPSKAAAHLFETLRWSETVDGAIRVFVPELVLEEDERGEGALVLAVKDKLTRAASAVVVSVFR